MRQLAFFISIFFVFHTTAQTDSYLFGGSDDDFGTSFTFNELGGYVLLSTERIHIDSSSQIVVRSIDSNGNLIWRQVYGDKHHDQGNSIERTSDGGYIVAGSTWDWGYGRLDAYVLKLDKYGDLDWSKHFGGYHRDEGFSIKEVSSGGYILAGFTKSDTPTSYGQMLVVRMDPNGNMLWTKELGGPGKDYAFDVVENGVGEFVIVGQYAGFHDFSTFEFTETHSDILVHKLDASGNEIWNQQLGGIENELCNQLAVAPQGGYYLIGSTQSFGNGSFDAYLLKIDEAGNEEWSQTYGSTDVDYGRSIAIGDNQSVFIAGSTANDITSNRTDGFVKKLDLNGVEMWSLTFGGAQSEYVYQVKSTDDGGCAVIGSTRSEGNGGEDGFFMKLQANGEVESMIGTSEPFIVMYPNPASESLTVYYQDNGWCFDKNFSIYDLQGKVIEQVDLESKVIQLDVSNYAAGEYYLHSTSECATSLTRKFIVLR